MENTQVEIPYEVLGIHTLDNGTQVSRVRMFIDGKAIDEDLVLPGFITVEEQIDANTRKRIDEIKNKVKAKDSDYTVGDGNEIVNTKYTRTDRGY